MKTHPILWRAAILGLAYFVAGAAQAADPSTRVSAARLPNVYHHPQGATFRYPAGWKIDDRQAVNNGLVLLQPADAAMGPAGPAEVFIVTGAEAGAIQSVKSPAMIRELGVSVNQLAPTLQRSGGVEELAAGKHPGIALTWAGNGMDGRPVQLRVFSTILDHYVVSLIAVGRTDLIQARENVLRGIFATFDFSEPSATAGGGQPGGADAALAGVWKNWEYKAVGNSSWEKTTFTTLRADGAFVISKNSESAHSFTFKDSGGNVTGQAGLAGQGAAPDASGRWSAAGGRLTLAFGNGERAVYQYQIRPNSSGWPILYLKADGAAKATEWTKVR